MTEPTEEARAVAAAMVKADWGDTGAVTDRDIREAERFIAAADALIACRKSAASASFSALCDQVAAGTSPAAALLAAAPRRRLVRGPDNVIRGEVAWPSDGTSEPAIERQNGHDGA